MSDAAQVPGRRMADHQIVLLQQKLDSHIERFEQYRTESEKREAERWAHLMTVTERNAKGLEDLTKSTQGMIDAWQAASTLTRFVKWLSSFAVLGSIAAWLIQHFKGG